MLSKFKTLYLISLMKLLYIHVKTIKNFNWCYKDRRLKVDCRFLVTSHEKSPPLDCISATVKRLIARDNLKNTPILKF